MGLEDKSDDKVKASSTTESAGGHREKRTDNENQRAANGSEAREWNGRPAIFASFVFGVSDFVLSRQFTSVTSVSSVVKNL
jgi:hypothetical protein